MMSSHAASGSWLQLLLQFWRLYPITYNFNVRYRLMAPMHPWKSNNVHVQPNHWKFCFNYFLLKVMFFTFAVNGLSYMILKERIIWLTFETTAISLWNCFWKSKKEIFLRKITKISLEIFLKYNTLSKDFELCMIPINLESSSEELTRLSLNQ